MSAMDYYERKDCRYCGSTDLRPYLDLGDQPPSNSFIKPGEEASEARYPLKVYLCPRCGLSQLTGVVSASHIFNEYQYLSSTSKALVNHYQELTALLCSRFRLSSGDAVLDIGCNDGIMLGAYPKTVKKTVGVEPSKVADLARGRGHAVYDAFFDSALAGRILREHGPMKIITATNVFAHIDDIHEVVEGIRLLASAGGVFVIETPYVVDMVEKNYFDTIYHEHLCYLGATSLSYLMDKHGLEIFDVERIAIGASGPAIRVFCQLKGGGQGRSAAVGELLAFEERWGIRDIRPYREFAERLDRVKAQLLAMLRNLRGSGARIGAYGAPAKGNTLLNTLRLGPDIISDGVAETSAVKQGKLTPGSHLPIVSEREFIEKMPDYALLLTWNYLDFFLQHSEYIKKGGRFIVPLPNPDIRPKP